MRAWPWIPLALATLLAATSAHGEEPRDCLPADLKLRVAFAEPKRLAEALRELEGERKRAGKLAVLKRRFTEAGCAQVEEQAGDGLAEPNLVCRIPGRGPDTIAIGSSPAFDGWPAAALLPEIARAVAAAPREHAYAIAVLSRAASGSALGAHVFADSFSARPPRVFVHAGMLGAEMPEIGPEADDARRCVVGSIARAALGASVRQVAAWDQVSIQCVTGGGNRYSGGTESLRTCSSASFSRLLDVDPFVQRGVPVAGLYAYPKRDRANFAMAKTPRLDPVAYVAAYRVLAALAVALDRVLGAPTNGIAP